MEFELARNWSAVALWGVLAILFGVAAILFGVVAFLWPGFLWLVTVYTFGAYAVMGGITAIVVASTGHSQARRWSALLLEGVVSIAAGVVAFFWPDISALALLCVIAAWSFVRGLFQIITAVHLRRYIRGEWLLILGGVLSMVLGVALAVFPLAGMLVLAWWTAAYLWVTGVYSIVFGGLLLGLAFRLRGMVQHAPTQEHAMAH